MACPYVYVCMPACSDIRVRAHIQCVWRARLRARAFACVYRSYVHMNYACGALFACIYRSVRFWRAVGKMLT